MNKAKLIENVSERVRIMLSPFRSRHTKGVEVGLSRGREIILRPEV